MEDKKITIIGLGLIGGSLAKALRQKLNITNIIGINRSIGSILEALEDEIICEGYLEINENVYDSDIIFICTPIKTTIEYIKILVGKIKASCILTDVGSTKGEILKFINDLTNPPIFIGGHPMAGTEQTGYKFGFSHLFENAYYVLTPSKSSDDKSMEEMCDIVKEIGSIPIILDYNNHDETTACISHVPHIIAAALVNLVKMIDNDSNKASLLAAGGFKDITRIASSNPEIWENIILSNREKIKGVMEVYVEILNKFMSLIEKSDSKEIYRFFESSKKYRDMFFK